MYKTEGIILKKIDCGEADSLFAIYTKDFGKINALARGIRKEGAKLRGHLEVMSLSRISFVAGGNGPRLTHALLIDPRRSICTDENKFKAASYLIDMVDKHCFQWEKEEPLWIMLVGCFQDLETKNFDNNKLKALLHNFRQDLNRILGYGEEMGMWANEMESPF